MVGLLLSLARLVQSEFEPGNGIRRVYFLRLMVDTLATAAAQAREKAISNAMPARLLNHAVQR